MRKLLLAGSAALLLSLGAAGREASANDQAAYSASIEETRAAAIASPSGLLTPGQSIVERQTAIREKDPNAGSLSKNILSALRTAALIGFGCFVVGLSAVGVTALWISDRTEDSAREFEPVLKSRS